jgi:hypothetical protein
MRFSKIEMVIMASPEMEGLVSEMPQFYMLEIVVMPKPEARREFAIELMPLSRR